MDGSETIFTFSSTQEWTATVDADKPWCTVSPANGVAGTAMTITMTVAENTTYDERVATITIASKDIEQKIDIIQSQNDSFSFTGAPTECFAHTDGEFTITALENTGKPEVTYAEDVDWIEHKVEPATKGHTETKLVFTVKGHESYEGRSGEMTQEDF